MGSVSQNEATFEFIIVSEDNFWLKAKRQTAGLAVVPALLFYYSGHFFLTSRSEIAIFLRHCELVVHIAVSNDTRFFVHTRKFKSILDTPDQKNF
jgi:hypothetical protein